MGKKSSPSAKSWSRSWPPSGQSLRAPGLLSGPFPSGAPPSSSSRISSSRALVAAPARWHRSSAWSPTTWCGTTPTKACVCPGRSFPLSPKFGSRNCRPPAARPRTGHDLVPPQRGHRKPSGHRSRDKYARKASSVPKFTSNSVRFRGYSSTIPAYYILGSPESSGYPRSGSNLEAPAIS